MCISVFLYFVLPLIQFIKMKIERNLTEFFCFSFFSVYGDDELTPCFPIFLSLHSKNQICFGRKIPGRYIYPIEKSIL